MNLAVMSINAQLAARAVKEAVGLEAKIKAGMRAVIEQNFMDTNEDSMMQAALAAVLLDVGQDSEDSKRLTHSIDAVRKLSAFLTAAQAGLYVSLESALPDANAAPLPLIAWWHEAKTPASGTVEGK